MKPKNSYLNTAEIVWEEIKDFIPAKGKIDKEKLNINLNFLVDVSKDMNSDIPLSMSTIFGIYTMSNFASQFQHKIVLGKSKIPTNMVAFCLVGSGMGKDSTVNAQRKSLDAGYAVIQHHRESVLRNKAQDKAEQEDGDTSGWQKHYREPLPLDNAISTAEGLTHRLNAFARDGIGMPSVKVSELGSELASNPNMTDNIRLISELFDSGDKESKAIKDSERQDSPVSGMGMCALFVGSEDNIILDKSVSVKFKTEFVTKLARRSMFVYPSKQEIREAIVEYSDYEDMTKKQENFENMAAEAQAIMASKSMDMASHFADIDSRLLNLTDGAMKMYKDYKMYTTSLGQGLDYIHKSIQLEQMHRSWKMLKLAGVFAMWDLRDDIIEQDIEEAVYIVEMIGHYLDMYEDYASKDSYELLVDFFKSNNDVGLTIHEIKKRGFINGTTGIEGKIKDLVRFADSFAGSEGMVSFQNDLVKYKPFERVGEHAASYVQVSGDKQNRAVQCHSGYVYKESTFGNLSKLMANDCAYTPFKFVDGNRKNDNIISGATWAAFDIDDTDIDIYEMHDILGDYNHHISTTSDNQNMFKYRILLEFNNVVDIPPREWKSFMISVANQIGLSGEDKSAYTKSQIQFGYVGSVVMSNSHGEPFDVSEAIKDSTNIEISTKGKAKLSTVKMRDSLDNPLETFRYAFNDEVTSRSLIMFRVWNHAMDLNAKPDEIEALMYELNEFWINPIDDGRMEKYTKQMTDTYAKHH